MAVSLDSSTQKNQSAGGSGCNLAKEGQEVAVWLPQLPGSGRTRRLCAGIHTAPANQSNDTFRSSDRWCAYQGESGVCGQGSASNANRQFKKAEDQERNHASHCQTKTAIGRQKLAQSIDQQKALHCRTVFRHNQTPIQKNTPALLRYGKSQRPSHTEKYLHESEKSSQQNLRRSTIKGSNPSKCHIRKSP